MLKIETVPVEKLTFDPANARKHSDDNLSAIASSLKEFGQRKPIVVTEGNVIVAGNGTVEAALLVGLTDVDVVRVPKLWSADQVKAFALADNRSAELAEWNPEVLSAQLLELEQAGFDVEALGFDLVEQVNNKDLEEDEVPELPVTPVAKLGEIWQLGNHRLMVGDATDLDSIKLLTQGKLVDLVYTDPPYGVNYDGGHATEKRRDKLQNDDDVNMYDLPIRNAAIVSKNEAALYLWFADRYAIDVLRGLDEAGWKVRNWIIWNKNLAQFGAIGAQYKSKHEPLIYAFKKGKSPKWVGPNNEVTVWDVARDSKNEYHPTQKPLELAARVFDNHGAKTVLDLFGGSGATLIAAEKKRVQCFMMELDPKYCDVIIQRWETLTGQKAVLENASR